MIKIRRFLLQTIEVDIDRFVRVECLVTSITVHSVATQLGGKRAIGVRYPVASLLLTSRVCVNWRAILNSAFERRASPSISAGSVGHTLFPSFLATARESGSEFIET